MEIAKFDKTIDELSTTFEKWLYVLKNLSRLDNQPQSLRDKVFDRLFTQAEIAKFNPRELKEYEDSRKAYRDLKNCLDTAMREGIEKGRTEGRAEGIAEGRAEGIAIAVKAMYSNGMNVDAIAATMNMTPEKVKEILSL